MTTADPRALQLAESRYRNGYGAWCEDAWDTLDPHLRQHLIGEAEAWLRAAVEAGIAPPVDRPSDEYDAVWVDDQGFLYGEYPTVPPSDSIVRLVWADDVAESKAALEERGAEFRLLGWSL